MDATGRRNALLYFAHQGFSSLNEFGERGFDVSVVANGKMPPLILRAVGMSPRQVIRLVGLYVMRKLKRNECCGITKSVSNAFDMRRTGRQRGNGRRRVLFARASEREKSRRWMECRQECQGLVRRSLQAHTGYATSILRENEWFCGGEKDAFTTHWHRKHWTARCRQQVK